MGPARGRPLNRPATYLPELDALTVVETERLLLHEAHDPKRLAALKERVTAEGAQANPVIASKAGPDFLVLDGAHRVLTLREIGCPLALVQLVDLPPAAEGWQHVFEGNLDLLREVARVNVRPERAQDAVAEVEAEGSRLSVHSLAPDALCVADALWALQSLYPAGAFISRLEPDEKAETADGTLIVRYRPLPMEKVLAVVASGAVLPAGVTRFRVPRRILGVRFPLNLLRSTDLPAANAALEDFIARQTLANRVRRYDEPVLLFE